MARRDRLPSPVLVAAKWLPDEEVLAVTQAGELVAIMGSACAGLNAIGNGCKELAEAIG